jgi:hypothetical protein
MRIRLSAVLVTLLAFPSVAWSLTTPQTFLGHAVGADKKLADYGQIVRYFETFDRESPRLSLVRLGKVIVRSCASRGKDRPCLASATPST